MQAPLYVRPLTDAERGHLAAGLRSTDVFVLRRCQAVLAGGRGEQVPRIAAMPGCDQQTVRIVVCPLPVKSPWLNPIEPRPSRCRDAARR